MISNTLHFNILRSSIRNLRFGEFIRLQFSAVTYDVNACIFQDMSNENENQGSKNSMAEILTHLLVYACILLVPVIMLVHFNYVPFDDCLRHAAKAVSGRSWNEILLLRDSGMMDQHPGWHTFLGCLHSTFGIQKEGLVVVEWTLLFALVSMVVIPLFRRPEAWIAALLVASVAFPETYIFRLTRGRPYLFTQAVMMILIALWGRTNRKSPWLYALTVTLIGLSTWVHGTAWHLWLFPIAAFFLSGRWREALPFAACWLTGSLAGATLTGHPFEYLSQQLHLVFLSFGNGTEARQLVGEFQPGSIGWIYLLAVGLIACARRAITGAWLQDKNERFFMTLAFLGWLAGLQVSRLWNEWGLPACQLWLAFMIQDILSAVGPKKTATIILSTLLLGTGFTLSATADWHQRWSRNFRPQPIGTAADGWLPDSGGLIYSPQMDVFLMLFFERPVAPWRYVYGYESGLMTEDNLQVLRTIQFSWNDWETYAPWANKMKPADRLIIETSARPPIPSLEWHEHPKGIWIGRKRGATALP